MTQNAGGGNTQHGSDDRQESTTPDEAVAPAAAEGLQGQGRSESPASQTADDAGSDDAMDEQTAELNALRAQAEENWQKYLRVVAELENLRKRNARDVETARKFGMERLAADILPVRDSIEAALGAGSNTEVPVTVETLLEGEQATLQLLNQALETAGVQEIDPLGEVFDPNKHEAMTTQPSAELPPDTVAIVVQKGYELKERLLRPARVIVTAPVDGNQ